MKQDKNPPYSDELEVRKGDHIALAKVARTNISGLDTRFNYEPLFFTHPAPDKIWKTTFLNFEFNYPVWISSMTGGTKHAKKINENLARLCGEFKLGMGLGSCRCLLEDKSRLDEFAVKKFMHSQPLFANIGIAQIEQYQTQDKVYLIHEMVKMVEADGLIIHINPLQEWFQPEGDRFRVPPIQTLHRFLRENLPYKVMIKEVGHGMGPKSLKAILELPIAGIELAGFGGTNFTLLEKIRGTEDETREGFISVGHSVSEMINILNILPNRNKEIIISGGINSMIDGFNYLKKLKSNSVIGMASAFLTPALNDYQTLKDYFLSQRESLLTAQSLLEIREEE